MTSPPAGKGVTFSRKLKRLELVEFCPFCGEKISPQGHKCLEFQGTPQGTTNLNVAQAAGGAFPKYCPLCHELIDPTEGHACP